MIKSYSMKFIKESKLLGSLTIIAKSSLDLLQNLSMNQLLKVVDKSMNKVTGRDGR